MTDAIASRFLLNPLRGWTLFAVLAAFALMLLQVLPRFWGGSFYFDWINHVWLVEYYSNFLREHLAFPLTIDAAEAFGNPLPMFYGIFIYPLMSLLGVFIGGDLAVRITCAALIVAPTVVHALVIGEFIGNRGFAILLACAATSSVYQLTNIYARGALTEFIAHQLILIAVPLVIFGLSRSTRCAQASLAFGFSCALIGGGAHPITLHLCIIFVAPLLILLVPVLRPIILRKQIFLALLYTAGCALLLLPWAMLTFLYRTDLRIASDSALSNKLYYFPLSIDSLWAKTGIGLDTRTLFEGLSSASTPFLEAPWPVPSAFALAALLILIGRRNQGLLCWMLLSIVTIGTLVAALSLPPTHGLVPSEIWAGAGFVPANQGWVYQLLIPIQFAYRLSNPFAVVLSVSLISCAVALSRMNGGRLALGEMPRTLILVGAVLSLAATAQKTFTTYVQYKLYPAYVRVYQPDVLASTKNDALFLDSVVYKKSVANVGNYPPQFYSINEFAMSNVYSPSGGFDVCDRGAQGAVPPVRGQSSEKIKSTTACVIKTNIVPTAFQQVYLNGRPVDRAFFGTDFRLWILTERGEHEFMVRTKRENVLKALVVSIAGALAVFLLTGGWLFWVLVRLIPLGVIHAKLLRS